MHAGNKVSTVLQPVAAEAGCLPDDMATAEEKQQLQAGTATASGNMSVARQCKANVTKAMLKYVPFEGDVSKGRDKGIQLGPVGPDMPQTPK